MFSCNGFNCFTHTTQQVILKVEAEVVAVLLDDTEDLDNQQFQSILYHA